MLYILVFVLSLFCFAEWFLNRRRRANQFWALQGPAGALIFGNCLQVVSTPVQLFGKLRQWSNSHKDFYRQWIYPYGVIHIYNPEDTETILSNPKYSEKSLLYDFLRPWLHDGLLLSKGNKWQIRRKILTPGFHFNILCHFSTSLEENSWRLVKKLKEEIGQEKTNITTILSDATLNAICETAMGTKLEDNTSTEGNSYKGAIHEIGKLIIYRIARSWLVSDFVFNLTKEGRRQKEVLKIINNFPKKIIDDRREYIKLNGFKIPESDLSDDLMFGPTKRRMAMLDLLLSAEQDGLIDEDGIQEEVDTFMFEGHDTASVGLAYVFMELANNKHIQDLVLKELTDTFGDSGRPANMQDLAAMKYLECCIKETLRLYPPVPFISRFVSDEVTLKHCTVPAGKTLCHIHIFDLHRREDLYPNPLKFNPERFTLENCDKRHPYAYIPFSGGSRNCIGQRLAMLEMKSVLSAVLRQFELLPVTRPSDLEFTADLVLRTTKPVYVKFVKRN